MLTLTLPRDLGALRDEVAEAMPLTGDPDYSRGAAARLFALWHGHIVLWINELNAWALWDGARWDLEGGQERVRSAMHNLCTGISHAALNDEQLARSAASMARSVASDNFVDGALKLARGLCGAKLESFDADPWVLNCSSGIIDLRTGTLSAHDPLARCTRLAPVTYDPQLGIAGTRFEQFIGEVLQGDADLIAYTRAALGYCLTGDSSVHALFFWYGSGRNGKSTLGELVMQAMGDYARKVEGRMLMLSNNDRHPTEIAQLRGVRLALASEVNKGAYWDEARIKELTGDKALTGRGMRQDYYNFVRTHKFIVYGNNKPRLKEIDPAIKARLKFTPFNVNFQERGTLDETLPEQLAAELPAVLGWLVAGAMSMWASGRRLPVAKAVTTATDDYLDENDILREWIAEQCYRDSTLNDRGHPRVVTRTRDLYRNYALWKRDRGEGVESIVLWRQMMRAAGVMPALRDGVSCFAGIGLLFNPDDASAGEHGSSDQPGTQRRTVQ